MEKKNLNITMFSTMPRIGCDESGKGDYFGGIVVAGVYLNEDLEAKISKFGIKDSKKLSDKRIFTIADSLKKAVPYSIVRIYPEKYNELYNKMQNLNKILAWAHCTVIKNLYIKNNCELAIIDKFTVKEHITNNLTKLEKPIEVFEFTNAESDMAVASASIIARQAFIQMIKKLNTEFKLELPLGSSHIKEKARDIVKKHGFEILRKIAKFHFKTTKEFHNLSLDL